MYNELHFAVLCESLCESLRLMDFILHYHKKFVYFTYTKIFIMKQDTDLRIIELGLILPPAPKPVGVYKPVLVVDKFLYVSGQGPILADGSMMKGKLGADLDINQGKLAARQVGLTMLSTIKFHFGELKKIKRIVKVLGMVNSTQDFESHPAVINGFSELMAEVFGEENGVGVRSAVGAILPMNIAVEIEAMFELY
jgi:enamine deaminase RidA (YjgF/YER057c/UK114 family)